MFQPKTKIVTIRWCTYTIWAICFFGPIFIAIKYQTPMPLILSVSVPISMIIYFVASNKVKRDLEKRSKNGTLADYLNKRSKPNPAFKVILTIFIKNIKPIPIGYKINNFFLLIVFHSIITIIVKNNKKRDIPSIPLHCLNIIPA